MSSFLVKHYFFFAFALYLLAAKTFANGLDSDQDRQNVGPDLDPNHFDKDIVSENFWKSRLTIRQQK